MFPTCVPSPPRRKAPRTMGGTFSSRGTADDAETETSQPTTNGKVVELQAVVAATSAAGTVAIRDEVERGLVSMWNNSDGERSKRLAGAVVKCKPGCSPAWYFVPTSRPVVAHGLRVAVNPAFERCIVVSPQDLEDRVECIFLGVLADPSSRPQHGIDSAAIRHTWRGAREPIQVAVYGAFGGASGMDSVGAPTLELVHGELDSVFRVDLQGVLGELGIQALPWMTPGSPSRAELRLAAVQTARLAWVFLPTYLGFASTLEAVLLTLFMNQIDPMVICPGMVRAGALADFVAGFVSANAVDSDALVMGIHVLELERLKVAEGGSSADSPPPQSSVGNVTARLMGGPDQSPLLLQAAKSVAAHQAAHPGVATGGRGLFVNAGHGLAVALTAQHNARASRSLSVEAPGVYPTAITSSPIRDATQEADSTACLGDSREAAPLNEAAPSGISQQPTSSLNQSSVFSINSSSDLLRHAPASYHGEAASGHQARTQSSTSAQAQIQLIHERRRLRALELQAEDEELQLLNQQQERAGPHSSHSALLAAQEQDILALRAELELARQPIDDAEILRRAHHLQAQLVGWPSQLGGASQLATLPHHHHSNPAPSIPPGFPPGFPHHPGSSLPPPAPLPSDVAPSPLGAGAGILRPPTPGIAVAACHTSLPSSLAPLPTRQPLQPSGLPPPPFASFLPQRLGVSGTAVDPRQALSALAAAAARAGSTGGDLGLVTFLAHLNGHRDLAIDQRPVGSLRCAVLASDDLDALVQEMTDVIAMGPSIAGGSQQSLAAFITMLGHQPLDWDAAYIKLDNCLAAVQQQRAFRTSRNIQLGSSPPPPQGPQYGGGPAASGGTAGDGHAAGILGHAVTVFHTDAASADRSTPSATMVQPLATSAVVMAEATAVSRGNTLGEVNRQVATYGQRAFAFLFGMGKVHGGRVSGGLPARLVESNASLPLHARGLILDVVGVGFDVGLKAATITELAGYIHVMDWETGVTDGLGGLLVYPRVEASILVLGGDPATSEFTTTQRGRSGGASGSISDPSHVKQAARHLEYIMVQLHHHGGRAELGPSGSFGISAYVDRCVATLDLPRALHLFGTLMMKLHRAMDVARRVFNPAFRPGDPTLDILGVVREVEAKALPVHEARQLSDESVDARLTQLGVNATAMQRTASAAVTAAITPAVDKAIKASRWGPPIIQGGPPPAGSITPGNPAAGAAAPAADPTAWLDTRIDWLTPVRALELAIVGTPSAGACPWYSLFSDCRKARADKCLECPGGILATQAMVDAVKLVTLGSVQAKITGAPRVPNPNPGTGKSHKRKGGP